MRSVPERQTDSERRGWVGLVEFLVATFLVAGISSRFTLSEIPTWYAGLAKPSFNPPAAVFGPVWTALYSMMAVSAWLIWRTPQSSTRSVALRFFWIQLAVNFAWSVIFFGQHRTGLGLLDVVLLFLLIVVTTRSFFRLSAAAGWMLVPYLTWVGFASILNFEIWRLN